MFNEKDVKFIFDKLINNYENIDEQDARVRYIHNKIDKHGYLNISLSELNYLYYITANGNSYDITILKDILKYHNIGYTSIIKNVGIPKATLSKLLNNERNVKLITLNLFFEKIKSIYNIEITKNDIRRGE